MGGAMGGAIGARWRSRWAGRDEAGPMKRERGRIAPGGSPWRRAGLVLLLLCGVWAGLGCSDPDRRILAGLDEADQARFRRGRRVATPCWTCHDLAGRVRKVGPSLQGIYGRRSGQAPDYQASDALRSASLVWDDRTLAAFLRNPAGFVPGTMMVSPGVQDPQALADLLFYLRRVTEPGARD